VLDLRASTGLQLSLPGAAVLQGTALPTVPSYVLTESSFHFLLEDDSGSLLLET